MLSKTIYYYYLQILLIEGELKAV